MVWHFQKFALGLDLIGNPVRLMANFEMGTKDLIRMSHKVITYFFYKGCTCSILSHLHTHTHMQCTCTLYLPCTCVFTAQQGIVEGEIGSGIALGVKSFLGHIVGKL